MKLTSNNIKHSNLCPYVYYTDLNAGVWSSFINNYFKLEATRKSFDVWMRKLTEVHANDEVLVEWKQMAFENMQSHGWILNVYW